MDHQLRADNDGGAVAAKGSHLTVGICSDTTRSRVRLTGELDINTLPRLKAALRGVRRDGHTVIELDLADLTFLCASALQVLVDAHTALHDAGGRLVLRNPRPAVQRILELTELDDVLITAHHR